MKHQKLVERQLEKYIKQSRKDVIKYYLPIVQKQPPDELSGQITTKRPTAKQARDWLSQVLESVFPSAESVVGAMVLHVHYQDVTYETLKQGGFTEKLKKEFPHVDWAKPFREFDAAEEKGAFE